MKRFQSIIQKYITNHERHKKYLAGVLALSVLVSFGVSAGLIMPAISMTEGDLYNATPLSMGRAGGQMLDNYDSSGDNNGYSPAQRSVKELLIGSTDGNALSWANGAESPSDIAKRAEDTYFLGIAYDFCLFLEGNATLKDADAEGRVAVGGNLIFDGGYCYQVGAGNFGYMTALKDTDDYQGISGFAHAIVGGYMKNIHPLSTGNNKTRVNTNAESKGGHQGFGETLYFPPTEDEFKRFVVGDAIGNSDATHMHCNGETKQYNNSGSHDSVAVNELAEMYHQPEGSIINFTSTFEWLRERSIALGEKKATGTVSTSGNTITFTIPKGMENADTVYFDLPEGVDYSKLEEINFVNVPKETTEMVVRETETDELKTVTKNIPKCNLVINGLGNSFDIRGTDNTVKTTIKYVDEETADEISNTRDLDKRDPYNKNSYHNNADPTTIGWRSNNHPASSKILYNFPNATTGTINGNFNGTIFAPNADVTSDNGCTGHLSGALIAKSFEGGLEFGYRPYRGTSDILGSKSGYGVPIRKIIKDAVDENGNPIALEGATFEITNSAGESVGSFTSNENGEGYVNIPSQVDFSGDTIYTTDNNSYSASYTIKETDAPSGFVKDGLQAYNITVTETVGTAEGDIITIDGKSIPTKVTTVITSNAGTESAESFTIDLHDIYSYENGTYKRIRRELKIYSGAAVDESNLKDTFFMDVDGDGKVTRVMRDGDSLTDEKLNQYAPTNESKWEVQKDTKKLNATEYIYKSDLGDIQNIENIIVYKDEDGSYKYITNTTNESDSGNEEAADDNNNTNDPVSIIPATSVYKVTGDDSFKFVKYDESAEIKDIVVEYPENSFEMFVNSDGYVTTVNADDLIEVHEKVTNTNYNDVDTDDKQNADVYNIGKIAWGDSNYPDCEITFFYKDKEPKKISSPTFNDTSEKHDGTWNEINWSSDVSKDNVIGMCVDVNDESSDKSARFILQTIEKNADNSDKWVTYLYNNDKFEVDKWDASKVSSGTQIIWGTVNNTKNQEISYQAASTKVDVRYALNKPVLSTIEHDCYTPIYSGEAAKSPQTYTSNGVAYKYDPETVMMMPQPSNTKTFTNERGLVFKKVGKSGDTEEALKGATIAVKKVTSWNENTPVTESVAFTMGEEEKNMDNILDGGSETTVDVNKLAKNQLYCFEETEAPGGYETANSIYFKKSGNAIYYTTDVDKAKSDNTDGWESVDLTKNGTDTQDCITMTDIKISGAKIRLGKWKADYTARLGGAKFQLCASDGTTAIYPLGTDTFTIEKDTDFDLYETLKNATDGTYNPDYIKNGYLKPGIYVLKEVNAPTGYDAQDFSFRVKDDNSIEAIASGTPAYFKAKITDKGSGNGSSGPKQIGIQVINKTGEEISVTNVTRVEIELNSPDSGTIIVYDDGVSCPLNTKTTSISNGLAVFDNLNNISLSKFKLQNNSYDVGLDIKEVRIYGEEGAGSGSGSGDYPAGVTVSDTEIKIEGEALKNAKASPDSPFIKYNITNKSGEGGQIKVNDKYVGNNLSKLNDSGNEYTLNEIANLSSEYGDIKDFSKVALIIWNSKFDSIEFPLSNSSEPDPTPSTPTDPTGELLNLTIGDNGDIKIPNKKAGADMKVNIEKIWAGDTGFESLRPESIEVELLRKNPDGTLDSSFTTDKKTLNLANNWKAEWSNLDRLVADTDNAYKYYIKEISNVPNYNVSYSNNNTEGIDATGTITITNTLKTKDINVTKKWVDSENNNVTDNLPSSITVQLQWKDKTANDNAWEDVSGKTLNLTSANNYTGKFENIPDGKDYQVVEKNAPTGWTKGSDGNASNNYTITNKRDSGSLKVEKKWLNDEINDRPNDIQIAIYRIADTSGSGTDSNNSEIAYGAKNFNPNNTDNLVPNYDTDTYYTTNGVNQYNDYARLLQYSLYFYDANMCGSDVENLSAYSWRKDCHTDDEVKGGFHDAGDYVMFGLPQGYTASTLGWSYYEFKDAYEDLGLTNHFKDISKHFADFFYNAVKLDNSGNVTSILYQKGDGNKDHAQWGNPDYYDRKNDMYWTDSNTGGSDIAGEYAAALALYAKNFPKDPMSEEYLAMAEKIYTYGKSLNKSASDKNSGFYAAGTYKDDLAWAAAWLAVATGKSQYKDECETYISEGSTEDSGNQPNGYSAHQWSNVLPAAKVVASAHLDKNYWNDVNTVLSKCTGTDLMNCNNWGNLRYNLGYQLIALVKNKYSDNDSKDSNLATWCKGQMEYILGKNNVVSNGNPSTCFVTGFAENSPVKPHYRATAPNERNNSNDFTDTYTLVGGLVGGPNNNGYYKDIRWSPDGAGDNSAYAVNEVACDYNANLVMAAAGLYHLYKSGKTYANIDTVSPAQLNNISVPTYDAEPQSDDMTVEETEEDVLDGMTLDNPTVDVETGEDYTIDTNEANAIITKTTEGDVQTFTFVIPHDKNAQGQSFTNKVKITNLNIKNATEVELSKDIHSSGMNCQIDGWSSSDWLYEVDSKVLYEGSEKDFSFISFDDIKWWSDMSKDLTITIKITAKPSNLALTPGSTSVQEGGEVTINANKDVTEWVIPEGLTQVSSNSRSCTVKAGTTTGTFTITAKNSTDPDATATIIVTGADIQILEGTDDVGNSIKIHQGATKTVTVSPLGGDVTVEVGDENIVKVTPESAQANANLATISLPTGRCNINAGSTIGNTDITFTRNGVSKTINAEVVGDLTINGSAKMNKNSTQTLTVENAVGGVWWEVEEGSDYITIDSYTGKVTSNNKTGVTATVKVYDIGGQEATFTITIDLTAVEPDIPEDSEFVKNITLNSGNNWQAVVDNLDKVDQYGNPYHYYIVELGSTGRPATEITGNGVTYIPVGYLNNGSTLDENKTLSVTNEKSETEKPGYTLPSAGGKGADWYYIIGAGLMSGAVVMFVRRRRRSA